MEKLFTSSASGSTGVLQSLRRGDSSGGGFTASDLSYNYTTALKMSAIFDLLYRELASQIRILNYMFIFTWGGLYLG